MIITKYHLRPKTKFERYLTIKDIRKLGRHPNLPFDKLLNSPKILSFIKRAKKKTKRIKLKMVNSFVNKSQESDENGDRFERIVVAKVIDGKLKHLIKWKDNPKCSLLDSTEVNRRWPQEVIKYYQKHLHFPKDNTQNH